MSDDGLKKIWCKKCPRSFTVPRSRGRYPKLCPRCVQDAEDAAQDRKDRDRAERAREKEDRRVARDEEARRRRRDRVEARQVRERAEAERRRARKAELDRRAAARARERDESASRSGLDLARTSGPRVKVTLDDVDTEREQRGMERRGRRVRDEVWKDDRLMALWPLLRATGLVAAGVGRDYDRVALVKAVTAAGHAKGTLEQRATLLRLAGTALAGAALIPSGGVDPDIDAVLAAIDREAEVASV